MNAPVKLTEAEPLADLDDFAEACADHAWFHLRGWIDLQTAVDNLQAFAENVGYLDTYDQDEIQAVMARAFLVADLLAEPADYAIDIVRRWELTDLRDRWRHTGELAPPAPIRNADIQSEPPKRAYQTPKATINAFWYVLRLGDSKHLATWLAQHPLDAPNLHKIWMERCSTAIAA
jgi:hypothetical protein